MAARLLRVTNIAAAALLRINYARLVRSNVAQNKPGRNDCRGPETKVQVNATNLCHDLNGSQTVAHGLPSRFSSAQQGSVPDDLLLGLGQILDDEVPGREGRLVSKSSEKQRLVDLQKHVVQLESEKQKDKHSKGASESRVVPVVGWLRAVESGD